MARHLIGTLFSVALPLSAYGLEAPPLAADPTRPPESILAAAGIVAPPISGGRLTSVLLPAKGRASAVIDGQVVLLGGQVGAARLSRVTETGVVLEGADGIERLYLTPDVEKNIKLNKTAIRRTKDKP